MECRMTFSNLCMIRNLKFLILKAHQNLIGLIIEDYWIPSNLLYGLSIQLQVISITFSFPLFIGIIEISFSDLSMFFRKLSLVMKLNLYL